MSLSPPRHRIASASATSPAQRHAPSPSPSHHIACSHRRYLRVGILVPFSYRSFILYEGEKNIIFPIAQVVTASGSDPAGRELDSHSRSRSRLQKPRIAGSHVHAVPFLPCRLRAKVAEIYNSARNFGSITAVRVICPCVPILPYGLYIREADNSNSPSQPGKIRVLSAKSRNKFK